MHGDFALLLNLAASLALALVLGLLTEKLKLSPIVGYLLAGIVIGPHTPGFSADPKIAAELAEIGVILLMFGVGLHFNLSELLAVRRIALPGAIGQILVALLTGCVLVIAAGMGWQSGVVIGIAISVASTVVLIRMLMDNDLLHSPQGHIAVGWLIVEDIFTVLVLVALPAFGNRDGGQSSVWLAIAIAVAKVIALATIVVGGGKFAIPWLLRIVASTRSRELFTLSILAIALVIATGSAFVFGVSMALGAFLAGMVVGQTEVSHQAAADALPMRDAFAVLFFVSVGMLFDPYVILDHPGLFLGLLAVVLIVKPLTAFAIVWFLRYSVRSAITVAIALAQIGEFSFLLAEEAFRLELLSHEGQSLLVACALVSITINPIVFRAIAPIETWLQKYPKLWQRLLSRSEAQGALHNAETKDRIGEQFATDNDSKTAIIIGYGPVGRTASSILRKCGVEPIVIDLNLDTVREINELGELAVYGDATRRDILEAAGILQARYLLITIPEVLVRTAIILTATDLNPRIRVIVRARYLQERAWLEELGTHGMVSEEGETAIGLAVLLLKELEADEKIVQQEIQRVQQEFILNSHGAALIFEK